jgi:hypothetical protein
MGIKETGRALRELLRGGQAIVLDFPVRPSPRYGYGKPPHELLHRSIGRGRATYSQTLGRFLEFREDLARIPVHGDSTSTEPFWINGFIPGLDAAALYALLCLERPARLFEIGSGNSTRFASRAIRDHALPTKITSIDPHPRAGIDSLVDRAIRAPLEEVDVRLFDELEPGDFLFVDGSHRVFMNSDVAVLFLEILPRLRSGVWVEFHDILLPFDYPPGWEGRYYSEQYMLAAYLLGGGGGARVVLPNAYISQDPALRAVLDPLWNSPGLEEVERHGSSFWMVTA